MVEKRSNTYQPQQGKERAWKPIRNLVWWSDDLPPDLRSTSHFPLAGGEQWRQGAPRQAVLVFPERDQALFTRRIAATIARTLTRRRSGRWDVRFAFAAESHWDAHPTGSESLLIDGQPITVWDYGLWPTDLVAELRTLWSEEFSEAMRRQYAAGAAGGSEGGSYLRWIDDPFWVCEEILRVVPLAVQERWPDPTIVTFLADDRELDWIRQPDDPIARDICSPALDWLPYSVERGLAMPCEIRFMRYPSGTVETLEGKVLGTEPDKQAYDHLRRLAAKCQSPAEERLFWALVGAKLQFEPQHQVDKYTVDLAFPPLKLAIEVKGDESHSTREQRERDMRRERYLNRQGWTILSFSEREAVDQTDQCVRDVKILLFRHFARFRESW